MKLATLIIEKLKQCSIYREEKNEETGEITSNVVLFSDVDVFPATPYVVVKPEVGVRDKTRSYRIIVHMEKGQLNELEDFVLTELDSLLLNVCLNDEDGGRYKLFANGYTDVTSEKIDNTYFMERIYYTPMTIR